MNRAMIVPNPIKDTELQITVALLSELERQGFDVFASMEIENALARAAGYEVLHHVQFLDELSAADACDFIIVLGGDGSILHTAELAAKCGKPILGINVGTVGFISELEPHELEMLESVKQNNFTLDYRFMLDIFGQDCAEGASFLGSALNDAVVGNGLSAKPVGISVAVDGGETMSFIGDGLIVSTPTGSTAYSLSAGGPVLAPSSPCIAVTPICPHSLTAKSLVVNDESEILVGPLHGRALFLSIDGRDYRELPPDMCVKIVKSRLGVSLIRIKSTGFYEKIRIKLTK